MPDSIHKKLESISAQCDELLLNEHLAKLVAEANTNIPQIEVKDLVIDEHTIMLDVREPEEFASGFIPAQTVLTIPRGKLEFLAIEKIAKVYGQNAKIITYCLKGPRGSLAAMQLKRLGFTNVSNIKGGIMEWIKSGKMIKNYMGEFKLV
jgi:rhodanese-related sulfurtransferase